MIEENQGLSGRLGSDEPTALAPPSGVKPASGLEQSRSSTDAGHALEFRRCQSGDLFEVRGGAPRDFLEDSDAYLCRFVAPIKDGDGKTRCFHCGASMDGFLHAIGAGAAYEWSLAHGEARCSGCGWPARGMHYPKGRDGEELYSVRNLFLAYHPDEVTKPPASVDTHPKDGDAVAAPLVSGAVGEAETPKVQP